ncbi:MAG: PAS domain S-box protein [gamma proteobacterium endosymbiont of Lamellibrachia anaximandri]|nr:PAS domain S-box protein [gamma proteobacterium endosymbiont of Lamellibrachia anaximandri]MBL3533950.1 PAS domain S-box protein [gamma proteobacterium endosymbiont of Lamellibrachia anaximandri]
MNQVERFARRCERERSARNQAERLLEEKSLELYHANVGLKQLARDLAEKEQRSSSILDAAVDGIVTVDEQGRIDSFNHAAEMIFGCSQKEAIGLDFSLFMESDEMNGGSIGDLSVGVLGNRTMIREINGKRSDETIFPMDLALSETYLGERRLLILVIRDISQRKQAELERVKMELQLRQAQKLEAIGQLAAGIAHEINTPTQFVSDNTSFLQDAFQDIKKLCGFRHRVIEAVEADTLTPELIETAKAVADDIDIDYLHDEIPEAIEQSLEGLRRIKKIVGAMKEFSHPGTEEKSCIDINQAIRSTVEVSRNEWKYFAEMVLELDPALPATPCLPGELNQAILNLIVNAAHAIEDQAEDDSDSLGTITIRTLKRDERVEIKVTDTGCGVSEDISGRIFDPFFTTKQVGKGTGQGLAIAYSSIVDRHGGTIGLESEIGRGTTFTITLPVNMASVKTG